MKIRKIREAHMNGESIVPKTDAELQLEKVEAEVLEKFHKEKVFF